MTDVPFRLAIVSVLAIAACDRSGRVEEDGAVNASASSQDDVDAPDRFAEDLARRSRWASRLLVVAIAEAPASAAEVARVRAAWSDWRDRDLRLVLLGAGGGLEVEDYVDGEPVGAAFGPDAAAAVARRYGLMLAEGRAAALVGKDGGVKHRWTGPVDPAEVFALVDAMPMRIREMREDDR